MSRNSPRDRSLTPPKFAALQEYDRGPVADDYVLIRDVMVPMRDGVRLATDIYLPAKAGKPLPGKFPAILDRTPYDKVPRAPRANDPEFFARRGYAFVFQDSRGHGNSEGEFSIYVDEGTRWLRCGRMGRQTGLVQRQGRHQRLFLRCRHPECPGPRSTAASRKPCSRLRHVELSQ
jgi:hypothetical protein